MRQPLLAKLYAAQASRERGNVTAEANQLGAEIRIPAAGTTTVVAPAAVAAPVTTPKIASPSTTTIASGTAALIKAATITPSSSRRSRPSLGRSTAASS